MVTEIDLLPFTSPVFEKEPRRFTAKPLVATDDEEDDDDAGEEDDDELTEEEHTFEPDDEFDEEDFDDDFDEDFEEDLDEQESPDEEIKVSEVDTDDGDVELDDEDDL
jgi:hypothetical protein